MRNNAKYSAASCLKKKTIKEPTGKYLAGNMPRAISGRAANDHQSFKITPEFDTGHGIKVMAPMVNQGLSLQKLIDNPHGVDIRCVKALPSRAY